MSHNRYLGSAIEAGYETETPIAGGNSLGLLFYADTDIRFKHICDRGARGVITCAPRLSNVNQPGGHQVTGTRDCPTVRASILCEDCGTHGFITEGRWAHA